MPKKSQTDKKQEVIAEMFLEDNLIGNMSSPIIILDRDQVVKNVNKAALDMLGISKRDVIDKDFLSNKKIPLLEDTFLDFFHEFYKLKKQKMCGPLRITIDGTLKYFRFCLSPLKVKGTVIGSLLEWTDITEERTWMRENEKKLKRISALQDISSTITSTLDLEKVLNLIIIKIVKLVRADVCSILLIDKNKEEMNVVSMYNIGQDYLHKGPVRIDESVTGYALKTGKIQESLDVQNDPRFQHPDYAKKVGLRSFLSVPLVTKDTPLGAINIYSKKMKGFSEGQKALLLILASQAAIAIEHASLYKQIKNDATRFKNTLEITQAISTTLRLDKVLNIILNRTLKLMGANRAAIFLKKGGNLFPVAMEGYEGTKLKDTKVEIGKGVTGRVAQTGKPMRLDDVREDPGFIRLSRNTMSEAAAPLFTQDKLIGVLDVESDDLGRFEGKLRELTLLANSVSLAIGNARLYHKVENFNKTLQDEILQATKELERKNRELEEKNKRLQELDKMKSEFVSIVSHELKTPLTSIKGYAALMLQKKIKNESIQKKCLSIINTEADKLANLIDDILDLSRLEAGKVRLKIEDVDPVVIIANVNNKMIHMALKKDIRIKRDYPKTLPTLSADKQKIEQMLTNLVSNSIKFTKEGGTVKISARPAKEFMIFSVSDTGVGIPDNEIPKLFRRFYQVDAKLTRTQGGTGLGLSIFKELVILHNGLVAVKSKENTGTTISFAIPLKNDKKTPSEIFCWEHNKCDLTQCPHTNNKSSKEWHTFYPPLSKKKK